MASGWAALEAYHFQNGKFILTLGEKQIALSKRTREELDKKVFANCRNDESNRQRD